MTKQEWENAFGSAPERFQRVVAYQLRKNEEEQPVKKIKGLTVIAIACVITLLGAVAYAAANQWDIQSFIGRWSGGVITEEGQKALQTMQPGAYTAENDDVIVTVRQAIYDGETLYVMVAATPKNPEKVLFLLVDSLKDDPVHNLGLPEHENDLTPIQDSELAKGKALLCVEAAVQVNGDRPDGGAGGHQALEADGTMVSYMEWGFSVADDVEEVEVTCVTYYWDKKVDGEETFIEKISFTFPLKVTRMEQAPIVYPTPEGE